MKRRIIIILAITLVFILFFPIRSYYDDGGTREYAALTYKIVKWNRMESVYNEQGVMVGIDMYEKTAVYFFPDNFKSIDELWEIEAQSR